MSIPKNRSIYSSGDPDDNLYVIVRGQVKTVAHTPQGKDCLLDIYTRDDIIGESCLMDAERRETAVTMQSSTVCRIPRDQFLAALEERDLRRECLRFLTARLSERTEWITQLVTADSEQRLALVLLRLGRRLGCAAPGGQVRIERRITQTELAEMVGTTRSRIGHFLKRFRELGLIRATPDRHLTIDEPRLADYVADLGL
jgi:CRP/FNR family cyclic AMP-dependent transcriptional regulator